MTLKRLPLLLSFLLILVVAGPSTARAQPIHTGFVDNAAFYNVDPETGRGWLEKARGIGAKYIRINVYWDTIAPAERSSGFEPADPGSPGYDWDLLDQSIKSTVENDMVPILMAFNAPRWAEGPNRDPFARAGSWKPDPEQFAAFGKALARRYNGTHPDPYQPGSDLPKVKYLQAWNEANLVQYLNPQAENGRITSPGRYRELLNRFSGAVKSVSPDVQILAAGLAPLGGPIGVSTAPLRFLRRMTCLRPTLKPKAKCEGFIKADILDIHPYTTGGPTHKALGSKDNVALGDLAELEATARAADRYRKIRGAKGQTRLWATEFSWDTRPPDPGGLPMWLAKRWTAEALFRMWDAGISVMTWASIVDAPSPDSELLWGYPGHAGFYFHALNPADARKKGSYQAFRFPFVAFRTARGYRFWGRTPDSKGGKVRIQQNSGSGWRSIVKVKANRYGVFTRRIRARNRTGRVRAIYAGTTAIPFSLKNVPDKYYKPFGG